MRPVVFKDENHRWHARVPAADASTLSMTPAIEAAGNAVRTALIARDLLPIGADAPLLFTVDSDEEGVTFATNLMFAPKPVPKPVYGSRPGEWQVGDHALCMNENAYRSIFGNVVEVIRVDPYRGSRGGQIRVVGMTCQRTWFEWWMNMHTCERTTAPLTHRERPSGIRDARDPFYEWD